MRTRELAIALVLAVAALAPAAAQQPGAPNAQHDAEWEAAKTAIMTAEKLLNAGQRGPESETCRQMDAYFLHLVKAAAAGGARTRIAGWSELSWDEQNEVAKTDRLIERNKRLLATACTDNPR